MPASLMDRRMFLAATALLLAGCAPQRSTTRLPMVPWPSNRYARGGPALEPLPGPVVPQTPLAEVAGFPGVLARKSWTKAGPVTNRMNRMLPVRYITVHHDGMDIFTGDSTGDSIARLERIRRFHRDSNGWGDIGYHFAVDRAGRIYEARPLAWQGAHVKDHNEGNIGVVALGNFDDQSPTAAQVESVRRHVSFLMQKFSVPATRVKTHQEWAITACPGRNLQGQFARLRANGALG